MHGKSVSPIIEECSWGSVTISGGTSYKDAMLYPGGSCEWDWNKSGTHHNPGIQPQDVRFLIDKGAEIIILSKGQYNRLKTSDQTLLMLEQKSIPYLMLPTEDAVEKYNQLAKQEPVGALIHSNC